MDKLLNGIELSLSANNAELVTIEELSFGIERKFTRARKLCQKYAAQTAS